MSTRAELDSKARDLGINPDEFSRKGELAAAIEAVEAASAPAPPRVVKTKIKGPVVVNAILHRGTVIEPGEPVPDDLSAEAIEILIHQGHVEA